MGFKQGNYFQEFLLINDVKFTKREVDIIAYLLHGRSSRKISELFSISPKTVETHIHNILGKIGRGNSREHIIDFVEQSNKSELIKQHYVYTNTFLRFLEILKDVKKTANELKPTCIIHYESTLQDRLEYIHSIEKHLNASGIHVISCTIDDELKSPPNAEYVIRFLHFPEPESNMSAVASIIKVNKKSPGTSKELGRIILDKDGYYRNFFRILKTLLPQLTIDDEICTLEGSPINRVRKNSKILSKSLFSRLTLFAVCLAIFCTSVFFLSQKEGEAVQPLSIRSDFPIPHQSVLLEQEFLIKRIGQSLEGKGLTAAALVGIGGSGKTTLARYYARQDSARVVWEIDAKSPQDVINSFFALAFELSISLEEKNELMFIQKIKSTHTREKKLLSFVAQRLKKYPNWLLLYDDVRSLMELRQYLPYDPKLWGKGRVLLTSQNLNIKDSDYMNRHNIIHIGPLNVEEQFRLFSKSSGLPEHKEGTRNFLKNLPPFPLDIVTAAHYIKNTKITYEQYLHHINTQRKQFVETQKDMISSNGYSKARYSIISLSLKNLLKKQPEFKELLLFVVLLNNRHIPKELLCLIKNPLIVDQFIYALKEYSLISNIEPKGEFITFSMHQGIQKAILYYLTENLSLYHNKSISTQLSTSLEQYIKNLPEEISLPKVRVLIKHAVSLVKHKNHFRQSTVGALYSCLARFHLLLGDYTKAHHYLFKSRDLYTNLYGETHPDTIKQLVYIADLEKKQGYYNQALKHLKIALPVFKKHYGAHHIKPARIEIKLGQLYTKLGMLDTALQSFKSAHFSYVKVYGKNHPHTAWATVKLGYFYLKIGKYKEAKPLLEEAAEFYNMYFDENHIQTAWALIRLGQVYHAIGKYREAKKFLHQSLEVFKNYYGPKHTRVAWITAELGNVYNSLCDYKKAHDLLESSFSILEQVFGKYHIRTAWALKYMGKVYRGLGEYEKSQDYLTKSMTIYKKHLGKDSLQVARIALSLGRTYLQEGTIKKSLSITHKALGIFKLYNHTDQYIALELLGDLYTKQTNISSHSKDHKSMSYYAEALNICLKNFPKESTHAKRIQEKIQELEHA